METSAMSMTCVARLRGIAAGQIQGSAQIELVRTSETSGLVVHTARGDVAIKGTGVSTIAPTAYKATALLPISDVVVFDGAAGIRSWSPPV